MKRLLEKWIPKETRTRLAARLLEGLMSLLYSTLRIIPVHEERLDETIHKYDGAIIVTWHGRSSIYFRRFLGRGYHALVSRSNDGEILSTVFERWGWNLIRGSSGRRPVEALRLGLQVLAKPGNVVALTPDGPRGPHRIAKPGLIYFAQKSGRPIIIGGVAASPCKFLRSWDSFLVPLPFARVCLVYSEPIFVRPEDNLEEAALMIQEKINQLEAEAEQRIGAKPQITVSPSPEAATETTQQNA